MTDADETAKAKVEELGFVTGAIVQLKSGGPQMTVTSIGKPLYKDGIYVWTTWFVGNKNEEGTFPYQALEIVSKD